MPQRRLPTSRDAADGGRCDHEPASDSSPVSSGAGSPTPSTVSTYGTVRGTSAGADSGRATRSSKTRSVTTLNSETPADSYMSLVGANGGGGGKRESSISMYHELATPTERPLKEFHQHLDDNFDCNIYGKERATTRDTNNQPILPTDPESNYPLDRSGDSYFGLPNSAGDQPSVGKFRYVVATLIILGVTISAYASNTMYIAAIEMISNDVLQSGLTELRAKHLSNDPLALDKNAALPGTCPVEAVHRSIQVQNLVASLIPKGQLKLFNATEISAHEHLAMQQDTEELYDNVNHRIESGQLVDWSIQQRGYVFTAHTIGTILMAVPVSRLGLVYGAKAMIFMCIFLASLRMAVLPTIAGHAPFWATFVFELVIGGVGGNIIILGYPIAAAWLLPHEANFFVAINILSSMVGVAATSFVSTQLLASGLEWCWCYYIPGIMLFLLSIGWFIFGSDKPETSRFVSRAELELLQSNTIAKRNESLLRNHEQTGGSPIVTNHRDDSADETLPLVTGAKPRDSYHCRCPHRERPECPANELKRKPNWLVIFTCPTMWALILVQFANHWTAKNATLWPTFYSNILHIDSSTIGIMIGIKGVWALIFGTLFAIVTRTLVINRPFNMSLTAYRRWNQAIATTIYSTSVILIVCLDCNRLANFIALLIQPLVSSFNSISHDQMPLDLSAEDSGLLVSVIRLLSIGDIVALPVSSYILSHAPDALAGDRATWKIVWSVGLAVRALASFYFVLVAKSRPKSYSRLEPSGTCKSLSEK